MYSIPCILLAGGKSLRMGVNKALLPFVNKTNLAQYQYDRLSKLFSHVYISAKNHNLFKINASFINETEYLNIFAPTVGLVSSFKQLKLEPFLFVLSVDTPFVNKEIFDIFLTVKINNYDAVIARTPNRIHPLCGIYSRSLEFNLQNMLINNNHKLKTLLKKSNVYYVDIENEDLLMNLNNYNDYQKALSFLQSQLI